MEGTNAEVDQPKMIYSFPEKEIAVSIDSSDKEDRAGLFEINSEFVMLLLNKSTTTKITTLNRINFYRVLLFMGNGAGIVSHGKSRALKSEDSMNLAVL